MTQAESQAESFTAGTNFQAADQVMQAWYARERDVRRRDDGARLRRRARPRGRELVLPPDGRGHGRRARDGPGRPAAARLLLRDEGRGASADISTVPAALRFSLVLVLIALVSALIAVRERPSALHSGSPVPAAVR